MPASSAAVACMASFTPKISWMMTTAPAGLLFGSTRRAEKLPDPSVACTVMFVIARSLLDGAEHSGGRNICQA